MNKHFEYKSVLSPFITDFVSMKELSGSNCLRTKWILLEIDRFYVERKEEEPAITKEIVAQWRKTRINDSPSTIYSKYSVIAQLSRFMSRRGQPCFLPKLPACKSSKNDFTPYIFSHEQISAIMEKSNELRMYDRHMNITLFSVPAILRLLYGTGLRISEALSLKNADVKFDKRYIHVRKTKNGSERIVPVNDSLYQVLSRYAACRNRMPVEKCNTPDAFFFIKADGTHCSPQSVYKWFRSILSDCGIPYKGNHHGPRIHDLRHTFAVHALIHLSHCGQDPYSGLPLISACLGHKSLAATEQYVRLTAEIYPEIVEKSSPVSAFVYPKSYSTAT